MTRHGRTQGEIALFRWTLLLVTAGGLAACTMTPQEIEKIQVENELLRREIQVMRENCERYRDLELHLDDRQGEAR